MKEVIILTDAGQIGMAVARRIGYGKKIIIGDKNIENAKNICNTMNMAGYDATPFEMNLASRTSIRQLINEAQNLGRVSMLINAAGVSPSQASVETILKVDLYGTAVLLEASRENNRTRRSRRNHFQSIGTPHAGSHSRR